MFNIFSSLDHACWDGWCFGFVRNPFKKSHPSCFHGFTLKVIGKIHALRKWPWGNAKFWVIFFNLKTSQKASNMLMQHSSTTQTKPKLNKIDIFFSAIFWDKLRGHFRMLKSQNISHALCAHFSWLRTARWDEKSGWWRCPKLDAKTLPNSQQPKRKKTQNVSKKTNCLNCKF